MDLRVAAEAVVADVEALIKHHRRVLAGPCPAVSTAERSIASLRAALAEISPPPAAACKHVFASYQGPGECVICGEEEEPKRFTIVDTEPPTDEERAFLDGCAADLFARADAPVPKPCKTCGGKRYIARNGDWYPCHRCRGEERSET